jgi:hypothetical protein
LPSWSRSPSACHWQGQSGLGCGVWSGRRPEVTIAAPACVTQSGGTFITHDHLARDPTIDRTPTKLCTTPATPAETTGEIVLSWGPDGPVVTAPDRAAVPAFELFAMRRVPGHPRAVELPGGIRYLIGAPHRRWRGAVYLHRLPQ